MVLLLAFFPALGLLPALQDVEWVETRFHRVHLLNGNFIDGQLLKDIPSEVRLKVKSGEMGIRRDQIDYVEYIKMRTINERPKALPPPTQAGSGPRSAPEIHTPLEIQKKVDAILFKLKASKDEEKSFPVEELRPLGEEAAVYLASRLSELDSELLSLSVVGLAQLKYPKTIPVLASYLDHSNPRVRANAAAALGYMGDAEKEKYLRPMLQDPDPRVRQSILGVLAGVEDKSWFDSISRLMGDPERDVRSLAFTISGKIARKNDLQDSYLALLRDLMDRGGPDVRTEAAGAVGSLGQKDSWPLLARLLNDSEPKVRTAAAMSLMNLAAPESGPDLVAQLSREQDRKTRIYLAGAVQRMKVASAIVPLIDWLFDSDEEIQKTAAGALQALTGQTFGPDREKWAAWLAKSGIK